MKLLQHNDNSESLEELMVEMVQEDYALIRKERRRLVTHRVASGFLALIYILISLFMGGGYFALKVILFLILPLSAIWFPDGMGGLTGVTFGRIGGPVVTSPSPGSIVRFLGWIVLLGPVWWFAINAMFY
jgi:hypothetical protein